jgi:hypothetical protein
MLHPRKKVIEKTIHRPHQKKSKNSPNAAYARLNSLTEFNFDQSEFTISTTTSP